MYAASLVDAAVYVYRLPAIASDLSMERPK